MGKEEYKANRARVYEIYGIDIHDRRYNCHHIVGKAEGGGDDKGNLIPLPKEIHEQIHEEQGDFIKPRKKRGRR